MVKKPDLIKGCELVWHILSLEVGALCCHTRF